MFFLLVDLHIFQVFQSIDFSIKTDRTEAGFGDSFDDIAVLAFFIFDDRRKNHRHLIDIMFVDLLDDFVNRIFFYFFTADRAMRHADTGIEQS